MASSKPRVRFAPSPTGYLHIGGARTALFNYLYARRYGGTFILRVEDTDQERSTPESVKAILDGLNWLGLDWDEGPGKEDPKYGPYFQTQRLDTYRAHAEQLISQGKAFRCYCTREEIAERRAVAEKENRAYRYEGTCHDLKAPPAGKKLEDAVIRFRMPSGEGTASFDDKVLGVISKPYSDLDDWVMMRADGIPLYNFGCVIDDHLMDITLVSRGQEHVNSTFPQLMLYQALGWTPPDFAHLPLILGPDREKLSKRKHPEADVMLHARTGIMPEALLNFVIRLGWSHGNDEVITREQMVEWFDFDGVGSTSGVWNPEKLQWLNQQWFKLLPPSVVAERLTPFLEARGFQVKGDARLEPLVLALRERSRTLDEMANTASIYFRTGVTLDEKAAAKHLSGDSLGLLRQAREKLAALPEWTVEPLDGVVKAVSESAQVGMGKVAQPLRVAITGNTTSPGIGETLLLVGRDEALRRIDAALARGG
ncbi:MULTISPECIES: glutamate--tRNA ligase [Corallococcus]|uniref:glutamate--tRNA ligase n=1 Tax=Corallococcus TaxID=83461 RepID=UPI00117E0F4D|nr:MULTISPECIES: glutamate--tRNA ligase [Corallococcus]NBD10682.1 glutamate--tRNA ligase [Corallococcus silvisoli]TSC31855.1 glutamate--tRNA ligase [Corallococcus sp. Z5C101001]